MPRPLPATVALAACLGLVACSLLLPERAPSSDADGDVDADIDAEADDADLLPEVGPDADGEQCLVERVSCGTTTSCPDGTECCNGHCANLRVDPEHCDDCDAACDAVRPFCLDNVCVEDLDENVPCEPECADGRICCRGSCCGVGEVCCRVATPPVGHYMLAACYARCPPGCPE